MKALFLFAAIGLLLLSLNLRADEVTPEMKDAFLSKLKTAIAHKDYKQFRELFYDSKETGRWLSLQTVGPFDMVLSDCPRTYHFQPPTVEKGMGGEPIPPYVTPIFHDPGWDEHLKVAVVLWITFSKPVPGTKGNQGCIPLIVKDDRLYAVDTIITTS